MARTFDGLAAIWWRDRNGKSRPHEGPVVDHLDFLDLARPIDLRRGLSDLSPHGRRELVFPHGSSARYQKDHIIGHEAQDSIHTAGFACSVPRGHELPDLVFI